jgi:hypothetical protein
MLLGDGHSLIAFTFSRSIFNLFEEITNPKYMSSFFIKEHFFRFISNCSCCNISITQFNIIWEGMNSIDTWIVENLYAPIELYCPSSRERKVDTNPLHRFQQAGQKEIREMASSITICLCIHKVAQELLKLCRLPQLEEIGKNLIMKELVNKVHDNTSHR